MKNQFVGEPLRPEGASISSTGMAAGSPGLPRRFSWKNGSFEVLEVLESWKQAGPCRHGSGERYLRKHWFRVRATGEIIATLYFERQKPSSGGSRWRLYTIERTTTNTPPGGIETEGQALLRSGSL